MYRWHLYALLLTAGPGLTDGGPAVTLGHHLVTAQSFTVRSVRCLYVGVPQVQSTLECAESVECLQCGVSGCDRVTVTSADTATSHHQKVVLLIVVSIIICL